MEQHEDFFHQEQKEIVLIGAIVATICERAYIQTHPKARWCGNFIGIDFTYIGKADTA